jgi:lipopolysaccharide transport system ATP-binding protein
MSAIIRIEGLGKRYRLGAKKVPYRTLRESIAGAKRLAPGPWRHSGRSSADTFWALKDISLEVRPGEVMGVIGRNGAGKSTLLKILGRISEPSEGQVDLYGRVGSLLGVGTGFHPDLTGQENIYLSGAILGMSRREITRKFDEIVAFGEVEKFIDTAVKYYSSGMYVRLAFAVAAHLESEILLVDEVLAVGDAAFQKKCLGKMHEASVSGRTVLFVSHNMVAVESLCTRCLFLADGRLQATGSPKDVIAHYLFRSAQPNAGRRSLVPHSGRTSGSTPVMTEVALLSRSSEPVGCIRMGEALSIRIDFCSRDSPVRPAIGVVLKGVHAGPILGFDSRMLNGESCDGPEAEGRLVCDFGNLPLMPGVYFIDLYFGDERSPSENLDIIHEAISFEVLPSDVLGTGKLPPATAGPIFWPGTFRRLRQTG